MEVERVEAVVVQFGNSELIEEMDRMLMTCEIAAVDFRIPTATSNEGPKNIPDNLPFREGGAGGVMPGSP